MSKRSMTYKYKDVRSDLNVKGDHEQKKHDIQI